MKRRLSSETPLFIDQSERLRMSHTVVPLVVLWAVIALWPTAPSLAAGRKVSEAQIQVAINQAVAHLRQQLANQGGGEGALITMALLKSGLPPDTPEIKQGLESIKSRI